MRISISIIVALVCSAPLAAGAQVPLTPAPEPYRAPEAPPVVEADTPTAQAAAKVVTRGPDESYNFVFDVKGGQLRPPAPTPSPAGGGGGHDWIVAACVGGALLLLLLFVVYFGRRKG